MTFNNPRPKASFRPFPPSPLRPSSPSPPHPSSLSRLFIVLAMMVITVTQAFAQKSQEIDSIAKKLPQLQGIEKLRAIANLINLSVVSPDEKPYTKMYIEEARKQKNIQAEGEGLARQAAIYASPNNPADSLFFFADEAIRFVRQHKMYDHLFDVQAIIIRHYRRQGQLLTALRKAEEAFAEAKELNENNPMAMLLISLAEIYDDMEQYEEAARCYQESIELLALDDRTWYIPYRINCYIQLAGLNGYLDRPKEILRYSDSIQASIDHLHRLDPLTNSQRHAYIREIFRAKALAKLKQPEQAYQAIQAAQALFNPVWNERYKQFAALMDDTYGDYYLANGNYDKALEYFHRYLDYAESARNQSEIQQTKKNIAKVLLAKGDTQSAVEIYRQIIERKETLNNERFASQINELRTIYELDKSEFIAASRLAALDRQRLVNLGLVGACLAVMLIAGLILQSRRKIAQKNRSLFGQINEQNKLMEELKQLTLSYEPSAQPPAETPGDMPRQQPAAGDIQQRQLVYRLQNYILDADNIYRMNMDRDTLAAALSTNRTTLGDAVRDVTGNKFKDYINLLRLMKAKQMLETLPGYTIEAIAEECGLSSRTFFRLFKERYHFSPAEYRKLSHEK